MSAEIKGAKPKSLTPLLKALQAAVAKDEAAHFTFPLLAGSLSEPLLTRKISHSRRLETCVLWFIEDPLGMDDALFFESICPS